jgi:hypothetical protein
MRCLYVCTCVRACLPVCMCVRVCVCAQDMIDATGASQRRHLLDCESGCVATAGIGGEGMLLRVRVRVAVRAHACNGLRMWCFRMCFRLCFAPRHNRAMRIAAGATQGYSSAQPCPLPSQHYPSLIPLPRSAGAETEPVGGVLRRRPRGPEFLPPAQRSLSSPAGPGEEHGGRRVRRPRVDAGRRRRR